MIKHLYNKVRWIIFIPITMILCIGISMFLYTSINNTIDITTRLYNTLDQDPNISSTFQTNNSVCKILIEQDGTVLSNVEMTTSDSTYKIAKTVSKLPFNQGFYSKYVYTIHTSSRGKEITLIENRSVTSRLTGNIYIGVIIFLVLLVILWMASKYIAALIIKPVEEGFDKQKMFISDASHELKTPLAVIGANIEVLENKNGSNKWSQYIVQEVNSMNKLVNDLLLLSKMEDVSVNKQENNLSQLVELYSSVFEPLAFESNIHFETNIEENIQYPCDSNDIERIVSVLIDNAIKHSDEKVLVSLSKQKHDILLTVSNTGVPISEEDQKKIFDRFYRVDKARNRQEKRYGLGLSIASSAASRNNGSISVQCANHITSFIVKFKA